MSESRKAPYIPKSHFCKLDIGKFKIFAPNFEIDIWFETAIFYMYIVHILHLASKLVIFTDIIKLQCKKFIQKLTLCAIEFQKWSDAINKIARGSNFFMWLSSKFLWNSVEIFAAKRNQSIFDIRNIRHEYNETDYVYILFLTNIFIKS